MKHLGQAKISDFGLAKIVEDSEQALYNTNVGTSLYKSPQILLGDPFSSKCDIWSLGLLFYELLYGASPWNAMNEDQLAYNIEHIPLQFPDYPIRSEASKNLIQKMLQFEESNRISWKEVFEHPIFMNDQIQIFQKMQEINDSSISQVLKLDLINKLYFQYFRVLQFNDHFQKIQANFYQQSQQIKSDKKILITSQFDISITEQEIIRIQDNAEKKNRTILQINNFLVFCRNKIFFIAYTDLLFQKIFQEKIINIPEHLYMMIRILFLKLIRHRVLYLFGLKKVIQHSMILQNQKPKDISREQTELYCKDPISTQFFNFLEIDYKQIIAPILKQIKEDAEIFFSSVNYNQKDRTVFNQLLYQFQIQFLLENGEKNEEDAEYQKMMKVQFQQIFETFVNALSENNLYSNRLFLTIINYLFICSSLDNYFQWQQGPSLKIIENKKIKFTEFSQFYEIFENENLEVLQKLTEENIQIMKESNKNEK